MRDFQVSQGRCVVLMLYLWHEGEGERVGLGTTWVNVKIIVVSWYSSVTAK